MQFGALKTLFERSWFSRKWTFQEIILARKAIVCCGSLEMVWDDLVDWCNALNGPHGFQNLIGEKHECTGVGKRSASLPKQGYLSLKSAFDHTSS
jgi:hypothetical protein